MTRHAATVVLSRGILVAHNYPLSILFVQVWPELLVLLCEGEADGQPWDQERQRQPGQASGSQQDASTAQQAAAGWQLLVKEYSRQEVLRKVVQVGGAMLVQCLALDWDCRLQFVTCFVVGMLFNES